MDSATIANIKLQVLQMAFQVSVATNKPIEQVFSQLSKLVFE